MTLAQRLSIYAGNERKSGLAPDLGECCDREENPQSVLSSVFLSKGGL